ncbi:putative invertase inhibitor [Rhodamnia argentea]|uniref:Invertase inhibitor n=1 Tax=Rhodamnia argentea TaxID=178133 RepID=A0ABM3HVX8_9MYRT|nr:putative invertase inhibitor [Rhodamnia argentea]
MNRALCTLSLFLASSLILFHAESAVANVIADTCRKCAASSPNVNYAYCVKALGSDPRSQTADVQGLGLIALNLLQSSVTSTGSYIQRLLKQKWDPYVQKCLSDCSDLYSGRGRYHERGGRGIPGKALPRRSELGDHSVYGCGHVREPVQGEEGRGLAVDEAERRRDAAILHRTRHPCDCYGVVKGLG